MPEPNLSTAPYAALLDACVLVPISLADTLLRIAECNLYRPLWSQRIVDEAVAALQVVHPEIPSEQFLDRFAAMAAAFEDALVVGWERFEPGLVLPDPDDRHVLAAAIRGSAGIIVTNNREDFPATAVAEFDIEVSDADAFLLDQLDLAPQVVVNVIQEQAGDTRNPALSVADLLNRLRRASVPMFVDEVRRLL